MKKLSKSFLMVFVFCLLLCVSALAASGEPSGEPSAEPAAEVLSGGFEVSINVNGEEVKTAYVGMENDGDVYTFQIGELLDVLGVTLSYDEQTGIATITAAEDSPVAELLNVQTAADAPSGEPSAEPAQESSGEPAQAPAVQEAGAEAASGEPSAEPSAEPAPAAETVAGDTSEAAYQSYLTAFVMSCEDILKSGAEAEFIALIEAGDYVSFPVEMLFDPTWFGEAAMTYEEFVAAGGIYEIVDHLSNGAMLDGTSAA